MNKDSEKLSYIFSWLFWLIYYSDTPRQTEIVNAFTEYYKDSINK